DDIKYQAGHSLLAILKETYGNSSNNAPPVTNVPGEFEGTYRVGETTCTVKPVKQAFEIRWAKGKGSEYFFYKDANVFESEPDKADRVAVHLHINAQRVAAERIVPDRFFIRTLDLAKIPRIFVVLQDRFLIKLV